MSLSEQCAARKIEREIEDNESFKELKSENVSLKKKLAKAISNDKLNKCRASQKELKDALESKDRIIERLKRRINLLQL